MASIGVRRLRKRAGFIVPLAVTASLILAPSASAAPNPLSVSPPSVANDGSKSLTITGTGFVAGATVKLTKTAQTDIAGTGVTVGPGGLQISGTFNVTNAAPGAWSVVVTNPDTTTGTCSDCLTVTAGTPTVTNADPSSRGQGATNQSIAITGTNFAQGAAASFSGTGITVNSTTWVSTTHVSANISVASAAPPGARNVTVTNTDAQSGSCTGCFAVNAGPTVTSTMPAAASNSGPATLAITGTNFVSGATVRLERTGQPNISGTAVVVDNSTTIHATFDITNAAPGAWNVRVTNADAGTGACFGCFTIGGATPTVTLVDPGELGQGAAGQDLTVTGTNFAGGAQASFSGTGITVNSTSFVSSTQVTANVTIATDADLGARDVIVTNTDTLSGTCDECFTVNAGPTVDSADPNARGQGAVDQDITIVGTGFVDGADITFSGTGITVNTTTFDDATHLVANIDVAAGATVGARDVTVTNPDQGTDTCAACFTVNAKPTVTTASPSSRGRGATDEDITITGTGFVDGADVTFSGTGITVNSTTFTDATHVVANIDVSDTATVGARNVTVTNPDAGNGSCTGCFTVNAKATVVSATPDSRGQGATDEDITITGTGFLPGAQVSFSGTGITVNSTTFVDATELTANIDVASDATPGARDVAVDNGDGSPPGACTECFTVNAKPTVTNASPSSRGQGATNEEITITGTGFRDGAEVAFSGTGITVNSTTFVDDSELTADISIASGATVGARDVTVDNGDGGTPGTCAACFTVNAGPTVTSTTPSAAANTGSVELTVNGTGFASGLDVRLQKTGQPDIVGTAINSLTPTSFKATFALGSAAPGAWDVVVTNTDAGRGSCVACFTVTASAPTVTSATPSSRGQGATVEDITVTGTNFAMGATVSFSGTGITVNSTTWVSQTELTVNIDVASDATPGARNVIVSNTDTQSGTCTECFTVAATPTVTSTNPSTRGQGATNQNITVNGTGFLSAATATFNGTGITTNSTTFVSATQLTVNIDIAPNATPGAGNVTVDNHNGGATGSCTGCFTVASPTVTSASPSSRGQGATNQNITITGNNFVSGSTASFSGAGITVNSTTFVSVTSLTVNIDVAPSAAVGARTITVSNGAGSTAGSCAGCFTVTAAPEVDGLFPDYSSRGVSGREALVLGSGFDGATTVSFSGTGITVNDVDTQNSNVLIVTFTISSSAPFGPRSVTVQDSKAGVGTCVDCFVVTHFDDVAPDHFAFDAVETIADAGITAGCSTSPSLYCPDSSITRGQMAVFLLRAMGHGATSHLPAYRGIFADVPASNPYARYIEHLYDHGVTAGCATSPRRYCPNDAVTRGRMAVFLLRAIDHDSSAHLDPHQGTFADVPSSNPFARFIEHLYAHGITSGCATNPLRYCPNSSVTRAQMAIFLVRTFGL